MVEGWTRGSCPRALSYEPARAGQSDGKSSLMEAFLGFRFNVREVEMGTRRPLIVQMVHDPDAEAPRCRLQNEDDAEYGAVLPEADVAETLKRRTEEHLAALGGATVSGKAMCMRVEYAYCPNLTIIDTPGLILKAKAGETDASPDAIAAMVKEYISPPHRLVLFLQQSSVEWASSLWLHVIQEVDPTFARTVMVCSKFDNRMREFKERWEVDKFLSASGYLPSRVKPFFVALPADRSLCTAETWRRQIGEVDASTVEYLATQIAGGYDEATFGGRIGFGNLRRYLENELARRYRESAPSTLAILQQRCDQVTAELTAATKRLSSLTDAAALRRTAMEYAAEVCTSIHAARSMSRRAHACAEHRTCAGRRRDLCSAQGRLAARPLRVWHDHSGGALLPGLRRMARHPRRRAAAQRVAQALWWRRLRALSARVPARRGPARRAARRARQGGQRAACAPRRVHRRHGRPGRAADRVRHGQRHAAAPA